MANSTPRRQERQDKQRRVGAKATQAFSSLLALLAFWRYSNSNQRSKSAEQPHARAKKYRPLKLEASAGGFHGVELIDQLLELTRRYLFPKVRIN